MPDDRRISELTTAEQTSASDLFETAIPNALSSTGFVSRKNTLATLATFMANTLAFTNLLDTNAKTLIGAINEVYAAGGGGASVAMGTTDPSSASGDNGDLYVKYDSSDYSVLGFWVKIGGDWRTISTGGGTAFVEIAQAAYDQLSYADKHSGIPYLITDGVLPAIEAADVTYDNTGSTLSADDVNEAIDELDADKMKHIKDMSTASSVSSSHLIPVSDGTHEYKSSVGDVVGAGLDAIPINYDKTVNGITYTLCLFGKLGILVARTGSITNATSNGDIIIKLSDFSSVLSGKTFNTDFQFISFVDTTKRFQCVANTENVMCVYGLPSGHSLRSEVVFLLN